MQGLDNTKLVLAKSDWSKLEKTKLQLIRVVTEGHVETSAENSVPSSETVNVPFAKVE